MSKSVLITAGHGGKDGGSRGYDAEWERERTREFCSLLQKELIEYNLSVPYLGEKNKSADWAVKAAPEDFNVSVHFNAFNEKAHGVEVLYKTYANESIAADISKRIAKAGKFTDRGAKRRTELYMLNIGFNILIEICFHDNKSDLKKYKKYRNQIVEATAAGIAKKLGVSKKVDKPAGKKESTAYYKEYTGHSKSIVDALKSIGISSAYSNRKRIAKKNGIKLYIGSASQNTKLLSLLKRGKLKKV